MNNLLIHTKKKMKKLVCIILFTVLSCTSALAGDSTDILFQGIPWLSNEEVVLKLLEEKGYYRYGSTLDFTHENVSYFIADDTGMISPDRTMGMKDISFSVCLLEGSRRGKIAGYPVKELYLTFAYDGEYSLIAVKVELLNAPYDDLKEKITRVYGEGQVSTTEEGICSIVWKGSNNSALLLYTQSDGLDYTLMYGRLDADNILSKCLEAEKDDISGL